MTEITTTAEILAEAERLANAFAAIILEEDRPRVLAELVEILEANACECDTPCACEARIYKLADERVTEILFEPF